MFSLIQPDRLPINLLTIMNLYNYKDFSMYKSYHFHSDHVTQQDGLLDRIL